MRGRFALGVAALLIAACSRTPPAAPTPLPSAPPAPVPGAAPTAVLSLGADGLNPPLAITNYEMLFDASRSSGDGLTFHIDFGDGTSSTTVAALHSSPVATRRTARLTVTDRFGRTDTASRDYYLAVIDTTSCCGTSWVHTLTNTFDKIVVLNLTLRQNGAALSGSYRGEDLVYRPVTGTISGDRSLALRTADGAIALTGALEWREGNGNNFTQTGVQIRLTVHGGALDGKTFAFRYSEPY